MPATTTAPAFRYVGIVDDVTTCERCGKPELKATTVVQPLDADGNADGDVLYYGSTCAARALGVKGGARVVLASARGAHHQTLVDASEARRMLDHYGLPYVGGADTLAPGVLAEAATRYVRAHRDAAWARDLPGAEWRGQVLDMLTRKQAAIAVAAPIDQRCAFCGTTH